MNLTDQVNQAHLTTVTKAAFAMVDPVQAQPPGEQALAAALLLLLWCRRHNTNPRDVLYAASHRFRQGLSENNQHVQALRLFMKVDVDGDSSIFL
jgi:hypothetical protein